MELAKELDTNHGKNQTDRQLSKFRGANLYRHKIHLRSCVQKSTIPSIIYGAMEGGHAHKAELSCGTCT